MTSPYLENKDAKCASRASSVRSEKRRKLQIRLI